MAEAGQEEESATQLFIFLGRGIGKIFSKGWGFRGAMFPRAVEIYERDEK